MGDIDELRAALDRIAERVEEARAATDIAADGDPTALTELDAAVDAIADQVAELKVKTSTGRL